VTRLLILGAGHIGRAVAHLLTTAEGEPRYDVSIADRALDPQVVARFGGRCRTVDGEDVETFARVPEVDQTFNGAFSKETPAPDRENPSCEAGEAPPWVGKSEAVSFAK